MRHKRLGTMAGLRVVRDSVPPFHRYWLSALFFVLAHFSLFPPYVLPRAPPSSLIAPFLIFHHHFLGRVFVSPRNSHLSDLASLFRLPSAYTPQTPLPCSRAHAHSPRVPRFRAVSPFIANVHAFPRLSPTAIIGV